MIHHLQGDCRDILRTLPENSVHCCVTSPPYWGLRDYATAHWEGGDPACDHARNRRDGPRQSGRAASGHAARSERLGRDRCARCGARRLDQQLGLEPTPELYVERLVEVFREVRRVLRDDGTLWLNLGDSYAGSWGNQGRKPSRGTQRPVHGPTIQRFDGYGDRHEGTHTGSWVHDHPVLKSKDLVGIPWRVAFALQADGWWLRSDIVWHKPNGMPESVQDRPTKGHEYVFLLSKRERYFYDPDAVREPHANGSLARMGRGRSDRHKWADGGPGRQNLAKDLKDACHPLGRNRRSVWKIPTQSYRGAHFATFPEALVEPCVRAGTSARGCCPTCGTPWERVVRRTPMAVRSGPKAGGYGRRTTDGLSGTMVSPPSSATVGWRPTCRCDAAGPLPCRVLDPFAGSGTTGVVAAREGREAILIELNPDYVRLQKERTRGTDPPAA